MLLERGIRVRIYIEMHLGKIRVNVGSRIAAIAFPISLRSILSMLTGLQEMLIESSFLRSRMYSVQVWHLEPRNLALLHMQ